MSGVCVSDKHWECEDKAHQCACPCHMFSQRLSRGPVGMPTHMCHPCGHNYGEHDDYGCLWYTCMCFEMGERK